MFDESIRTPLLLLMENRPFDHFFGFHQKELPGIDGLTGNEFNYYDTKDPSKGKEYVKKVRELKYSREISAFSMVFYDLCVLFPSRSPSDPISSLTTSTPKTTPISSRSARKHINVS